MKSLTDPLPTDWSSLAQRSLRVPTLSTAEWEALVARQVDQARRLRGQLALMTVHIDSVRLLAIEPDLGPLADEASARLLREHLCRRLRTRVRGGDWLVWVEAGYVGMLLVGLHPQPAPKVRARLLDGLAGPYRFEETPFLVAEMRSVMVCYQAQTADELLQRLDQGGQAPAAARVDAQPPQPASDADPRPAQPDGPTSLQRHSSP
jgi:hypothetical protein